ncbi:MAG: hypothetical protein HWN68_19200 [Desulfobacterales bacterium]|nr:hypothetical protein [Desulfobacterales bacterium]
MLKTFTTIIVTALVVLFGVQNFDHVPVYIFWGKMVRIRLIFVIALAVTIGYLIRHFVGIRREETLKREFQLFRRGRFKTKAGGKSDEFDGGDFE